MTAQQRKTLAVIMAVGLIGLVGLLTKRQMGKEKADAAAAAEKRKVEIEKMKATVPVVFVSRDISKRTSITNEDVKLIDVPERDFPKLEYVSSVEEVVGKISLVDMYSREAILRSRVAGKDKVTSLSFLVPKGMRAISVKINTVDACGGFLKQNDIVDILATFKVSDPAHPGSRSTVSTNFLRNVKVLAVDKDYRIPGSKSTEEEEEAKKKDKNKKGSGTLQALAKVSVVTLLLSPEDAERAVIASETASIKMILPSQGQDSTKDDIAIVVTSDTIQGVTQGGTAKKSEDGTPEMVEVNVIRAGKKFQRFMPYEEAKNEPEAISSGEGSDDEWIEPDGWDDSDDLTGVSLPDSF